MDGYGYLQGKEFKYKGTFKNGMKHGQGELTTNEIRYEGEWSYN